MNSMALKDSIRYIVATKGGDFSSVLRMYMYDRFIERLARSNYRDKFVLKGGFYLSSIFGLNGRATMDIDAVLKGEALVRENLATIINEIICIDINDDANIVLNSIEDIRSGDVYGGFRIKITVNVEKIRETFALDIVTGDIITPKEITYKYNPIIGTNYIELLAYNLETVLAEKLETILSRGETNSRAKDYYDIYLIVNSRWCDIDKGNLRLAISNTFNKRNFGGEIDKIMLILSNSKLLNETWEKYSKNNSYSKGIKYTEVIKCIQTIINEIL